MILRKKADKLRILKTNAEKIAIRIYHEVMKNPPDEYFYYSVCDLAPLTHLELVNICLGLGWSGQFLLNMKREELYDLIIGCKAINERKMDRYVKYHSERALRIKRKGHKINYVYQGKFNNR